MNKSISLLLVLLMLSSGCYSLRKKFVRKNSKAKEDIVYVNLKEYPQGQSDQAYSDYSVFFRSWLDEISVTLTQSANRKRIRHAFQEARVNLEEMIDLCEDEGRSDLEKINGKLVAVEKDFAACKALTNIDRIIFTKRISGIKSEFDADCRNSKMKKSFR